MFARISSLFRLFPTPQWSIGPYARFPIYGILLEKNRRILSEEEEEEISPKILTIYNTYLLTITNIFIPIKYIPNKIKTFFSM